MLSQAAHSSEMSSVPSWSMNAAKRFRSSLSTPSNRGPAKTEFLQDAVFRWRWSLLAFWELRNCPVKTQPEPSVPNPNPGIHHPSTSPSCSSAIGPSEPWAQSPAAGLLLGHCVPPRTGSVADPSWKGGTGMGPGCLEALCWYLQSPATNSSVFNCPVPAASSPSKRSSSSSVLHGKFFSCNF